MFPIFIFVFAYLFKVFSLGSALYIDDHESFIRLALNDGVLVLASVIFYLVFNHRSWPFNWISRSIFFIVFVLYVIDCYVISAFQTRLYYSDVIKYGAQVHLAMAGTGWSYYAIILLALYLVVKCATAKAVYITKKTSLTLTAIAIGLLLASQVTPKSVRHVFYTNFVEVNFNKLAFGNYTESFARNMSYVPQVHCELIPPIEPEKVVVILVESWSNYHSEYFGSGHGWTPNLDRLAQNNIALTNFYANGFSTEDGLYALFVGEPLLADSPIGKLDGTNDLSKIHYSHSLIEEVNALGYQTHFYTSGSLDFAGKGQWLEDIGFQRLLGENDFSNEHRRYLFESVRDDILFERAYDEISQLSGKHFVVIENVTTHSPYAVPSNDDVVFSEKLAFEYSDKIIADFVHKIAKENWMVVVVSDHRAMSAVTERELNNDGAMAVAKVPAFVVWDNVRANISATLQQTDLITSTVNGIKGKSCYGDTLGSYLPLEHPEPAGCATHRRGDDRSVVSLRCDRENLEVILDGDDTRVKGESSSQIAVDIVNFYKLKQTSH
ncbi:LTA synthase family protein [Vibrio sp. 10N]|uniref:LTA synthase family protein n=1 Tax=Vibrio sp. 10N TaxID=3058938 RepID=UPI0030C77F6D